MRKLQVSQGTTSEKKEKQKKLDKANVLLHGNVTGPSLSFYDTGSRIQITVLGSAVLYWYMTLYSTVWWFFWSAFTIYPFLFPNHLRWTKKSFYL